MNEKELLYYLQKFDLKIRNGQTFTDRTGVKFVEEIGAKLQLDPTQKTFDFGVKKTNEEYCKKELAWYDSMDRSIDMVRDVKVWRDVAAKDGTVNSNYGWCVFSEDNYKQFDHVLHELIANEFSRRAIMIYTRPSMWIDYNENGRNDFMCTNYHHFFIRENVLYSIYNIRSNDLIWGFLNDYWWAATIHLRMYDELCTFYNDLKCGYLEWQASSLHVYERHFDLVKQMANFKVKTDE